MADPEEDASLEADTRVHPFVRWLFRQPWAPDWLLTWAWKRYQCK